MWRWCGDATRLCRSKIGEEFGRNRGGIWQESERDQTGIREGFDKIRRRIGLKSEKGCQFGRMADRIDAYL